MGSRRPCHPLGGRATWSWNGAAPMNVVVTQPPLRTSPGCRRRAREFTWARRKAATVRPRAQQWVERTPSGRRVEPRPAQDHAWRAERGAGEAAQAEGRSTRSKRARKEGRRAPCTEASARATPRGAPGRPPACTRHVLDGNQPGGAHRNRAARQPERRGPQGQGHCRGRRRGAADCPNEGRPGLRQARVPTRRPPPAPTLNNVHKFRQE